MPSLSIPIHQLDSHGKDYVFALDESWLKGAFTEAGVSGDESHVGSVHVHAQRNGNEILVHGKAEAQLITECVRCLRGIPVPVACELAALYAPTHTRPKHNDEEEDDLEIDPNAPDREFYSGETIFIDDLVRDYLLLELPMQPRCDPACQSLGKTTSTPSSLAQGRASHPLNGEQHSDGDTIDPRLLPLKKLAQGEPEKE